MATTFEIARWKRLAEARKARRALAGVDWRKAIVAERYQEAHSWRPSRIEADGVAWVVAQISPGSERAVARDVADLGFTVYLPLLRRVVYQARVAYSNKRTRRVTLQPLFGPYIFVGEKDQPLSRDTDSRIIRIRRPVGFAAEALAREIRVHNDRELAGEFDQLPLAGLPRFSRGELVRVKNRSYDLQGIVDKIMDDGSVDVDVGGPLSRVTVPARDLDRVA